MRLVVLVASVVVVIVAAVAGLATLRDDDGDVISSPTSVSTTPTVVGSSSSLPEPTQTSAPGAVESVVATAPPATAPTTTTTTTPTTTTAPTSPPTTTTTTTTTTTPVVPLVACQNDGQNYRLAYPATWSAELDDPVWGCSLFDPDPFELTPNSELPAVAIVIDLLSGVYEENQSIVTEPVPDILIGEPEFRFIGGRLAVCAVAEATEGSYFDAGTIRLSCLAEWGADSLLIDAIAWPWLDLDEIFEVAEAMHDTIEPITPIPFRD